MKYIPAEGSDSADYMIVGEAPGQQEEKDGRPFVGPSGKILRYCMDRVGIPIDNIYITNVCHYRPPYNVISKWCRKSKKYGRVPNEQVREGMYELYRDIIRVRPKIIIPVGNIALWALHGKEEITKRRGSVLPVELDSRRLDYIMSYVKSSKELDTFSVLLEHKLLPTFHPAHVDRQYELKAIFEKDLKKAKRETEYPEIRYLQREIIIEPEEAYAYELAERLLTYDQFAFDIETPGGNLYCIAFSADPSWGFVLRTDAPWKMQLVSMLLQSPLSKICHNGLFDTGFLKYHNDIDTKNYIFDTMYAGKLCYPEFPQGLDFYTSFFTDEPYYKDEGKDQDLSIAEDAEQYMLYNGKDACLTMEVALQLQQHEMKNPRHAESIISHMRLLPIARNMMIRGLRVNIEAFSELRAAKQFDMMAFQAGLDETIFKQVLEIADKGTAKLKLLAMSLLQVMKARMELGEAGFNVNSSPEMKLYLYELRGFKRKKHKITRQDTTEEVALKEIYGETGDKTLLEIVKIRQIRKLLTTYLSHKAIPHGRLTYSVNLVRTKTQRWSSGQTIIITLPGKPGKYRTKTGVNAQTIPPEVRKTIIADPGMILFDADLEQAEDRIVAYAGGVKKKIEAYENGIDPHALSASGFFNTSVEEILAEAKECKRTGKTPPMRYIGKQSNHAFNYEEGWMTFMRQLNKKSDKTGIRINAAQSKRIRINHFALYPEIEYNYWAWIQDQLNSRQKIYNAFGYERIFYGLRHWKQRDQGVYRDAYSWYAQSVPPEIINRGMVRIHEQLPEVEILLHTHDGILGQCPEALAGEYLPIIPKLLDEPLDINGQEIHIPVDIRSGTCWATLE